MTHPKICPPEHRHEATTTCYQHHQCRCVGCLTVNNARRRNRYKAHAFGRYSPVVAHSPAIGTRRRLQALQAIGWSQHELADRLGAKQTQMTRWLLGHGDVVQTTTANKVAHLFKQLWNQQPPRATKVQKYSATRARATAQLHGWLPPLAWDDIDNDPEPPSVDREVFVDEILVEQVCNGHPGRLNVLERVEAIRILAARGTSDHDAAELLHLAQRTVTRIRADRGIPASGRTSQLPIAS